MDAGSALRAALHVTLSYENSPVNQLASSSYSSWGAAVSSPHSSGEATLGDLALSDSGESENFMPELSPNLSSLQSASLQPGGSLQPSSLQPGSLQPVSFQPAGNPQPVSSLQEVRQPASSLQPTSGQQRSEFLQGGSQPSSNNACIVDSLQFASGQSKGAVRTDKTSTLQAQGEVPMPPPFTWLLSLPREQRRRLRKCTTPYDARMVLAESLGIYTTDNPGSVPVGLVDGIQQQIKAEHQRILRIEEELVQQAKAHEAELAALREDHRQSCRRAKLEVLFEHAPQEIKAALASPAGSLMPSSSQELLMPPQ